MNKKIEKKIAGYIEDLLLNSDSKILYETGLLCEMPKVFSAKVAPIVYIEFKDGKKYEIQVTEIR